MMMRSIFLTYPQEATQFLIEYEKKSVIPCPTPETRDGRRHINRSTGLLAVRGGFALDIASSIWTVTPLPLALQRSGAAEK